MYKIIEEYNDSYHRTIGKKPILADYSVLTDTFETNLKVLRFKVADRVRITKCKKTFCKIYINKWFQGILVIDSVFKTDRWAYKVKDLYGEKTIRSFYEKECC